MSRRHTTAASVYRRREKTLTIRPILTLHQRQCTWAVTLFFVNQNKIPLKSNLEIKKQGQINYSQMMNRNDTKPDERQTSQRFVRQRWPTAT
jgi:hypothetical protein